MSTQSGQAPSGEKGQGEAPMRGAELGRRLQSLLDAQGLDFNIDWLDAVDSTNRYLYAGGEAGVEHGQVVLSEYQEAGKGRLGRVWKSPRGENLYLSILVRPTFEAAMAPLLTVVCALALHRALKSEVDCTIKWPNDILVGPRKLAGILAELKLESTAIDFVILGMGININMQALDPELADIATSVALERGEPVDRVAIAREILVAFAEYYDQLQSTGRDGVLAAYREACSTLGQVVSYQRAAGDIKEGVADAIDEDGALWIQDATGARHRVTAGDIRIRRP